MQEILLQTTNLTKQFGRHRAVDQVNLHIKKGSIYGFIGRNGAGKTTCLKMISGLSKPSSGEITLFGYTGKDLKKVRSRVGCLIEAPGLYGNMSAYENIKLKCKLFGIVKESYIQNILELVGLEQTGNKKTKQFSLGMKQRLGIGLALVGEPDLLILDENEADDRWEQELDSYIEECIYPELPENLQNYFDDDAVFLFFCYLCPHGLLVDGQGQDETRATDIGGVEHDITTDTTR